MGKSFKALFWMAFVVLSQLFSQVTLSCLTNYTVFLNRKCSENADFDEKT